MFYNTALLSKSNNHRINGGAFFILTLSENQSTKLVRSDGRFFIAFPVPTVTKGAKNLPANKVNRVLNGCIKIFPFINRLAQFLLISQPL